MNVCRRRAKKADIAPEEKWDFISLADFRCSSCLSGTAYGYLWVLLSISIAVYAVDTFTAINLLIFNRWAGEIEPVIPLNVSKWIFSACIIASWINLGFEYVRAIHVIKRDAVAESYLDSLAVRLQCIRMGKNGHGFRRFLVFAELTKSKKGSEYVALFTYFSFQAWIRIVLCEGPRKVINALTLYSVFRAQLAPTQSKDVGDAFVRFFKNVGALADKEHQQAVIISGMAFTLVIWIFAALSLILATLFYLFFLWHHIPTADGSLARYCERKINQRLKAIVSVKVNKALEADERKRHKDQEKALRKGEKPILGRQATLPVLFDDQDDKLPKMPTFDRQSTTATLPLYESQPGTPYEPASAPAYELDKLSQRGPYSSARMNESSASINAPLISNASGMGFARSASPAPSTRSIEGSSQSQRNYSSSGDSRGLPSPSAFRSPTPGSVRNYPASSASYGSGHTPTVPVLAPRYAADPQRPTLSRAVATNPVNMSSPVSERPPQFPSSGRASPALTARSQSPMPYSNGPPPAPTPNSGGYQAYNPSVRSASATSSFSRPRIGPPMRNLTDPMGPAERTTIGSSQLSLRENPGFPFP